MPWFTPLYNMLKETSPDDTRFTEHLDRLLTDIDRCREKTDGSPTAIHTCLTTGGLCNRYLFSPEEAHTIVDATVVPAKTRALLTAFYSREVALHRKQQEEWSKRADWHKEEFRWTCVGGACPPTIPKL